MSNSPDNKENGVVGQDSGTQKWDDSETRLDPEEIHAWESLFSDVIEDPTDLEDLFNDEWEEEKNDVGSAEDLIVPSDEVDAFEDDDGIKAAEALEEDWQETEDEIGEVEDSAAVELDEDDWDDVDDEEVQWSDEGVHAEKNEERQADSDKDLTPTQPVGRGEYTIKPGDCISSLAASSGHFWKTIWKDPANQELTLTRKNPNLLLPGDKLHIPPIRKHQESGETEKRHRFRRKGIPDKLRIRFLIEGEPLAGEPFVLKLDVGHAISGNLDDEGQLEVSLSGKAKQATVLVGGENPLEYIFLLGHLDSIDSITGIQQRLVNLGYSLGPIDGKIGPLTRSAIAVFQADQPGLTSNGQMDVETCDRLRKVHDQRFQ